METQSRSRGIVEGQPSTEGRVTRVERDEAVSSERKISDLLGVTQDRARTMVPALARTMFHREPAHSAIDAGKVTDEVVVWWVARWLKCLIILAIAGCLAFGIERMFKVFSKVLHLILKLGAHAVRSLGLG